eukprot:CAMPEP_0177251262 /NCGR_PEP_ID=MMETSP0367-20130122/53863_1 /TAXON_ID=447022 ORGANISM="Scrippsiella hangoei-like, Strain SHHI-4" /NCGR_SAMPLE_ID=MMETSP0367 /ASSEMBLY_ACC=CAM_ASM_000362 /LENGTH=377 /DNA_ID=CAMNT_0018704165 /DNA_START=59 /DNA_END=1192 /DNA_ORIENTATION=-
MGSFSSRGQRLESGEAQIFSQWLPLRSWDMTEPPLKLARVAEPAPVSAEGPATEAERASVARAQPQDGGGKKAPEAEQQQATPPEAEVPQGPAGTVTVLSMAGREMAVCTPVPANVAALKAAIEAQTGCPPALQRLVEQEGTRMFDRDEEALPQEDLELLMVIDETPMFSWDHKGNPGNAMLEIDGSVVKCPNLTTDYVNVLTREPMRSGVHYYQFIMHHIGDEQWCGVAADPEQAGPRYSGRYLKAWTYYCGRMRSSSASIVDGTGCLHAKGRAVKEFKKLKPCGDVIGMLVDLDRAAIAFELNGELQGACAIPKDTPLWVLTHVDTPRDHVELVKLSLQDAPQESIEGLSGALLEITGGTPLRSQYACEDANRLG